jgi:quinolinate synthase
MGMNSLQNLKETLETGNNEIHVSAGLAEKARIPIRRMLDFAAQMKK